MIDVAKILAAIQVPPATAAQFADFLNKLGYSYVEETNNPMYKRFLTG
jgi:threonine dehydratase